MSSTTKKIKWKYVYFDLPYLILVKDGLTDIDLEKWIDAYKSGSKDFPYSPYAPRMNKPDYFIIGGGFPVYLPPPGPLAEPYIVKIDGTYVGLKFLRRINNNRLSSMIAAGEIIGDRTGRATFSSVQVIFNPEYIDSSVLEDMESICTIAVDGVNKFLEYYRILASRFYIRTITKQLIQTFIITTEYDDCSTNRQEYGSSSGPLVGLGGSVNDKIDMELRKKIISSESPSIIDTLCIDIDDRMDLHEWRLVVIESAVLFETWLTKMLKKSYKKKGLNESEIKQKFLDKRNGYYVPKSIDSLVRNSIKDATGFDFSKTKEYSSWKTNVKDTRNKIVHGDKYKVSYSQALKAKVSTINAIKKIKLSTNISI